MPDPVDASVPARPNDAMFEEVYQELRRMAHRRRGANDGHTLNTTALVHEVYMQMLRSHGEGFVLPTSFYAYAARSMRNILIDHARERMRLKAGGDLQRVDLELIGAQIAAASAEQTLELDDALRRLHAENPRAAEVVELHYFAGLTIERIAELKQLSTRSIDRDWRFARAWLRDALRA